MPTSTHDRFSSLYARNEGPAVASLGARVRRRLSGEFRDLEESRRTYIVDRVARLLESECGAQIQRPTYASYVATYLEKCANEDVLDFVTFVHRALVDGHESYHEVNHPEEWIKFVERVFREENAAYRVDANCVAHFLVDEEHERNLASAIAALSGPKFAAARAEFEKARDDISRVTPDLTDAIRALFASVESVFKVLLGTNSKLDAGEVKKTLGPFVDRITCQSDPIAKGAAARFVEAFVHWVNAAHPYRHGHGHAESVEPPLDVAVMLMSTGAAYIRWLAMLGERSDKR